ncbi:MAG: hypothetical protein ACR2HM_09665 [Acidimicrobiales bacterium]
MSLITLVSMVPSGEIFVTRDASGRLQLHKSLGAGGSGPIDERTADLAVAKHGFVAINRVFASWIALDDFLEERAAEAVPAVVVDRDRLGLESARGLLDDTCRCLVGEGQGERARRLALNLLRVPSVLADRPTHDAVVAFLDGLARPVLMPPPEPASPLHARAREAWGTLAA